MKKGGIKLIVKGLRISFILLKLISLTKKLYIYTI